MPERPKPLTNRHSSTLSPLAVGLGGAAAALAIAGCIVAFRRHPVGNPDVPAPRRGVDFGAYLGRWYEIARYEQTFEKDCDFVTATYGLRPDGLVGIVNTSRDRRGRARSARASALAVPGSDGAKLKVAFFGPFYVGNYWVLDHAEDYSWSIVGDPSGRYLWLLHRDAVPGASTIGELEARAADLGYDTSMLRMTRQS
jgi:apolipoprotein D and lipocalin family protein